MVSTHTDRRQSEQRHNRQHDDVTRGPTLDEINSAFEAVVSHDVPGTPTVGDIRTLKNVVDLPLEVETRRLLSVRIATGRPQNGALRSDDHIGSYKMELPIREVDEGVVGGRECPHCGGVKAVFKYTVHHHIGGSESVWCRHCEEKLHGQEWG